MTVADTNLISYLLVDGVSFEAVLHTTLLDALAAFRQGTPDDDVTLVVARFPETAA